MASLTAPNTQLDPGQRIDPRIDGALRRAAEATGVDFQYLVDTAGRESSFRPNLTASTSSATGLFQFIEQTWLATVKSDGARFGLGAQAAAISQRSNGSFQVNDPAKRSEILELRKDPELASKLAGVLTDKNARYLRGATGQEPSGGELYVAHFLGAKGAVDLITAKREQPATSAADLFPAAAKANKSLFYLKGGGERTVAEVYANLIGRHSENAGPQFPAPERTLASHTRDGPADVNKAVPLAHGAEAAFLAGHYGASLSAFDRGANVKPDTFGSVFGKVREGHSFFAPEADARGKPQPRAERVESDIIASRYGRIEKPSGVELPAPVVEALQPTVAVSSARAEQVEVIVSSEFGKPNLPLDLSEFLLRNREK